MWELCNVETASETGRLVTVVFVVMNSPFVTLVVASSPLTVVFNEETVGGDVLKDSGLGVPLGDVTVDFKVGDGDGVVVGVGTDVLVAATVDCDNAGVVAVPSTGLPSLLRRVDRRQRMVTGSSFMVPMDCLSGSSLQSRPGAPPSQPGRAFRANARGVLNASSHGPVRWFRGL